MTQKRATAVRPQEIRVIKLDPTLTLAQIVDQIERAKRNREIVLRTPPRLPGDARLVRP